MATRRLRPIGHEERLSLVEHLDELRNRLIYCLLAFAAAFTLCWTQHDTILDVVNRPLERTAFSKADAKDADRNDPLEQAVVFQRAQRDAALAAAAAYRVLARELDLTPRARRALAEAERLQRAAARAAPGRTPRRPVTLGVGEPFFTTFTVAGYAALLLALPFILYQLYAFVLPAFSPSERRTAIPLMAMIPLLFVAGVVFSYFAVLPRAIDFLQNFNDDSFDILVQARDYYRFVILLLVAMGVLFQVPVGVIALTRLGTLSVAQIRRGRRYAILAIAVLAAVATPDPSPVTMLLAMAPLVVLFELSILLAALLERRTARATASDERLPTDDDEDPG